MYKIKIWYSFVLIFLITNTKAQIKVQRGTPDILYTTGHASAFIGGLYNAFYPYHQLKLHGNFGLGAPDLLDGELLMLDGKIYQTQFTGKTIEIKENTLTPFAVVNFFRTDQTENTNTKFDQRTIVCLPRPYLT